MGEKGKIKRLAYDLLMDKLRIALKDKWNISDSDEDGWVWIKTVYVDRPEAIVEWKADLFSITFSIDDEDEVTIEEIVEVEEAYIPIAAGEDTARLDFDRKGNEINKVLEEERGEKIDPPEGTVKAAKGRRVFCVEPVIKEGQSDARILIKDDEKRLVFGIVYEPDEIDSQDDWATAEDIEKAAHRFMEYYQEIGEAHYVTNPDLKIVESYIAPTDFKIDTPAGKKKQKIKKGTWLIVVKVYNDNVWKDVKSGELTGYSFEGTAREMDED